MLKIGPLFSAIAVVGIGGGASCLSCRRLLLSVVCSPIHEQLRVGPWVFGTDDDGAVCTGLSFEGFEEDRIAEPLSAKASPGFWYARSFVKL